MSEIKISVIIPTFNRKQWLFQAIDSVMNQDFTKLEVIVINDGSDIDLRTEVLERFPTRVTYLYQQHKGAGSARNLGLSRSQGDFIQFLDDDDWLCQDALSEKLRIILENPEIGAVYSDLFLVGQNGIISRYYAGEQRPLPRGDIFEHLIRRNFIPIHAPLWRKDILAFIGGFPERTGSEDWELLVKAAEITKFAFHDQPLGYYRLHESNITLQRRNQVRGDGIVQQLIAESDRFLRLNHNKRGRILVSYAWQQWLYGDIELFKKFYRLAQETDDKSKAFFALQLLTRFGRPFGRTLMQIIWQARALRRRSAGYYFLTKAKRKELEER